ncbi:sulfurtransferase [Smaragdicoccus niigatensis]|uniref:sulfurtransferase n=1 Tax=Smaragdicoccus niigatensis TaxID=359359 RepID=UPI0003700EB7|nr:sulfurtransferase [Smaragdicoccus niigatensis]
MTTLITAAELADRPAQVVLDVRWALGDPYGRNHYENGHIPGAIFVDLESELAALPSKAKGRHPLPRIADLQANARKWGISDDSLVVVYDAVGGTSAARAWWLLTWAGVKDVRILDGGWHAWHNADLPVERGAGQPHAPGDVTLSEGHLPTIDIDDAANWSGTLIDSRAHPRFRGDVEPVDPKAGHIPGAINAPATDNLSADGRFLTPEQLRAKFGDLTKPVAVYCGSGVTASHTVAALSIIGVDAALFPGSWSQWSNDRRRPVATGDAS